MHGMEGTSDKRKPSDQKFFLTEVLMTGVDGSDVAKGDTGRVTTACVLEDRGGKCHPQSPWGE